MTRDNLVVTGVGVVTPWTNDPAVAPADTPAPVDGSWFDTTTQLGPRGYRYLPPASRYLLAAARRAVAASGASLLDRAEERRAIVVATNHAATAVLADIDATVAQDRFDELSPALAPYFSINVYATRLSTEYATRGFAVTMTTPVVAGIDALATAARCARLDRADVVLVGVTEAAVPHGHAAAERNEAGAAVFVLERAHDASRDASWLRARTVRAHTTQDVRRAAGDLCGDEAVKTVRVIGDGSPMADTAAEALMELGPVETARTGAGCLKPMLTLGSLLASGGGPVLVAVALADGSLALAAGGPA